MIWRVEAWKRCHDKAKIPQGRYLFWTVEVEAGHPLLALEKAAREKELDPRQWWTKNPKPEVVLRAFPLNKGSTVPKVGCLT